MYVRDKSVPISALTNTQTENQDPFIAGQLAMMISHPSEYAAMLDQAEKATGADKANADEVRRQHALRPDPEGPGAARGRVRRLERAHLQAEYVDGGTSIAEAAQGAHRLHRPARNGRPSSPGSARIPATCAASGPTWMKQRLDTIRFLDVTTSMLPYGVPFPVIPESTEIMNIIVPDMMQNALTGKMTVDEAADDAADQDQGAAQRHVADPHGGDRRRSSPPVVLRRYGRDGP